MVEVFPWGRHGPSVPPMWRQQFANRNAAITNPAVFASRIKSAGGESRSQAKRKGRRRFVALAGCAAIVASGLTMVPAAGAVQMSARVHDDHEGATLVVALGSSLSDVGTAASLVAAGAGDAVLLSESVHVLGARAAKLVSLQQTGHVIIVGGSAAVSASAENELRRLAPGATVRRFAGTDRMHTAALAADEALAGREASVVIIANGWSLPDVGAAASAVAAGVADVVLYVAENGLGEATRQALARHRPDLVLVAGGTKAVSFDVEAEAAAVAGASSSDRLGGATRVETAALIAGDAFPSGVGSVVIANGWSLSDVGVAASLAAAFGDTAVLYAAGPNDLGPATERAVEALAPGRVLLVGDSATLSSQLQSSLQRTGSVVRVANPTDATYRSLGLAPPTGSSSGFAAVASGSDYACALRENETIACWGGNRFGQADAPLGSYLSVSARIRPHLCARHGSPDCLLGAQSVGTD